jgi:hypothetical protein
MENMDKKVCSGCGNSSCTCGGSMGMGCMHGFHHHGKYGLMRMILKIVIVILIFWCGFKLGNIVGYVRAESGRGAMMQRDFNNGGYGMMHGGYSNISPTTSSVTPAVPATPVQ